MDAHDGALLDRLAEHCPVGFAGDTWRIARRGLDPLAGSAGLGHWGAGPDIEVIYTSLEREGAMAEVGFRLGLEPVWPSRIQHDIHLISCETPKTLNIPDLATLGALGIDTARYQGFDYGKTRALAAAAYFLEFDGMLVPSARSDCRHLVIFKARAKNLMVLKSEAVDWAGWRKQLTPTKSSLI